MQVLNNKPQNLLFSLPDDVIRHIYEMDTTYKTNFSDNCFQKELKSKFWEQNKVLDHIRSQIYKNMLVKQNEGEVFGNRFLQLDSETSDFYFYNDGYDISDEMSKQLPSNYEVCNDLEKKTYIHFSQYNKCLRFAIVPLSFKHKANSYFMLEHNTNRPIYDGICTFDVFGFKLIHSIIHKYGKVNPFIEPINIPILYSEDLTLALSLTLPTQYFEPIAANRLRRIKKKDKNLFSHIIKNSSETNYLIYM